MKKAIITLFALLCYDSFALDEFSIGAPAHGGKGCPTGTASVILSPDQQSGYVIFDDFILFSDSKKLYERKSCNISLPLHVPQGFSVAFEGIDLQAFASLPESAIARISVSTFYAGKRGERFNKILKGPFDGLAELNLKSHMGSLVWSPCGANVNQRINISAMLRSKSPAFVALDTPNFLGGALKFKIKRCGSYL